MRLRLAGGVDLATAVLIVGGAVLTAASIVAATVLLEPLSSQTPSAEETTLRAAPGQTALVLPPDTTATVLQVDATAGVGSVVRHGDRLDVLGYFSKQVTGREGVTRLLLRNVSVLSVDRSGTGVALTLAVPPESVLLMHEAQAMGVRPFITLRPETVADAADGPTSLSDSQLAGRLAGAK